MAGDPYVWLVWIDPDGTVLGPSVLFGTDARVGYAVIHDGGWHELEACDEGDESLLWQECSKAIH